MSNASVAVAVLLLFACINDSNRSGAPIRSSLDAKQFELLNIGDLGVRWAGMIGR